MPDISHHYKIPLMIVSSILTFFLYAPVCMSPELKLWTQVLCGPELVGTKILLGLIFLPIKWA